VQLILILYFQKVLKYLSSLQIFHYRNTIIYNLLRRVILTYYGFVYIFLAISFKKIHMLINYKYNLNNISIVIYEICIFYLSKQLIILIN